MKTWELTFAVRTDSSIGPDFKRIQVRAPSKAAAQAIGRSMATPQNREWFRGDLTREVRADR
jgi:hypothetical protein